MKKMFRDLVLKYKELIVYCVIGCTGAALDFVVYVLLTHCTGLHYQLANFLGVSLGIINNFFLNRHFNFKIRDHTGARLLSFYAVGMFGWMISAVILCVFIEFMELDELVAKLSTIALVTVIQFCLNKYITFKKRVGNE